VASVELDGKPVAFTTESAGPSAYAVFAAPALRGRILLRP
jgi:hypothetical protein